MCFQVDIVSCCIVSPQQLLAEKELFQKRYAVAPKLYGHTHPP